MKKLLAILLSVLMLCTFIPFAAVSAADEATIEIYVEETELNAGDEFEVTVNLLNIPEPGLIGALVELDYDHDVMDLVWNWDEDEEDYLPAIEVGSKYNASSNKYISFGPQGTCLVNYMRSTATEKQVRYEEHFFTATFKIKDDAVSGNYTIGILDYSPKNMVSYGIVATNFAIEAATFTVNGTEPVCEHKYTNECDKVCALCGEETRPEAEHTYFYACDQYCQLCGEKTNPSAKHNVIHVEAVEATCAVPGNVEYWYCDACNCAWLDSMLQQMTNLMNVKVFKDHEVDNECDTDCNVCGAIIEPWHVREYGCSDVCSACGAQVEPHYPHLFEYACTTNCADCGIANPDVVDHDFVDGYCSVCGEMDAGFCIHEYWYPCDQYCMHCGELTNPDATHVYDDDADLECNSCGAIREIDITINVLIHTGVSVCADVNGLAFSFAVNVSGATVENFNEFVSGSIKGDYPLVSMGAIVSNAEGAQLDLDNVDGNVIKNVNAKLLMDADGTDGQITFAVRIIDIPNVGKNIAISAHPYFVYELDGVEYIAYGDVVSATYNNVANG